MDASNISLSREHSDASSDMDDHNKSSSSSFLYQGDDDFMIPHHQSLQTTRSWVSAEDTLSDAESSMSSSIKLHSDFLKGNFLRPSFQESKMKSEISLENMRGYDHDGPLRLQESCNSMDSHNECCNLFPLAKRVEKKKTLDPDSVAFPINANVNNTDNLTSSITRNFVTEHRIFVRAILSLLSERDQFAIEAANANDPRTIKAGPLRKGNHLMRGVWKVKYVEVRRGLFSYYEDNVPIGEIINKDGNGGPLTRNLSNRGGLERDGRDRFSHQRKSLPLRANLCTCRAVKVQPKNNPTSRLPQLLPNGFIFELTVEGGSKRLWMTNTREERQAWIHAIHAAMIGGSVTQSDTYLNYQLVEDGLGIPPNSPHRHDLEMYAKIRPRLQSATYKEEYLSTLQELLGKSLMIPVQWIKEQVEVESSSNHKNTSRHGPGAFAETNVNQGVAQLWRDILRDSVDINGTVHKGTEGHGPERIIGALTSCIMDFDKPPLISTSPLSKKLRKTKKKKCITESQATSFARDVLLSANRTRSAGDSYYCMDTLCSNSHLVALCPFSLEAEPLKITISHANIDINAHGDETSCDSLGRERDSSGWIKMRNKLTKRWKKRFCVLSEGGVLSYYEKDTPRPRGLRGQIVINIDTTMGVSEFETKRFVITIVPKDRLKERQFCFENKNNFLMWRNAFQEAINGKSMHSHSNTLKQPKTDNGVEQQRQPWQASLPMDDSPSEKTSGIALTYDRFRMKSSIRKSSSRSSMLMGPPIQINVKASSVYKICTTDPDGVDEEDTWATLQTDFLQTFLLNGSTIKRGEEIVQMRILEGLQSSQAFETEFRDEE